jgi:hypothetical protein
MVKWLVRLLPVLEALGSITIKTRNSLIFLYFCRFRVLFHTDAYITGYGRLLKYAFKVTGFGILISVAMKIRPRCL